ncbi:MAG: hypothetical protein PHY12_09460 [Eubacteriales bacterium]|nr:hypothetical protein [Eubacteriales bacterium]
MASGKEPLLKVVAQRCLHRLIPMLLIACLISGAYCAYSCYQNLKTASLRMNFDYEGANLGLYPNGTRINLQDVTSDEILERVLELSGLGEVETLDSLYDKFAVTPVVRSSKRVSTEYMLRYTAKDFDETVKPDSMVRLLAEAYREWFYGHFRRNLANLSPADLGDLNDREYLEIADLLKLRATLLGNYLDERISANGTFTASDGESYRSLKQQVEMFTDVQLGKFQSYIQQTGLYKDVSRYKAKLQYQNYLTDLKYRFSRAQYQIRQDAITLYDESIIAVVMIPSYNASDGYYMSRTDIGTDRLTQEADQASATSQKQNLKVEQNNSIISNMNRTGVSLDDANYETCNNMLSDLRTELNKIYRSIVAIEAEFDKTNRQNFISFTENTLSFQSAYNVSNALILFAALMLGQIAIIALRAYIRQVKSV